MTVLICGRDPEERADLARQLHQLAHRTAEAADEEEGVRLVQSHRPEAVIVGFDSKGEGDREVIRFIREMPQGDLTLVIALHDSMDVEATFDGYRAGVDMVLLRPLVPAELSIFRNRH